MTVSVSARKTCLKLLGFARTYMYVYISVPFSTPIESSKFEKNDVNVKE